MPTRRLKILSVIILLSVLSFIYFSDVLLSNRIFLFRDIPRYYYPLRNFAVSQVKSGIFPFWNPYISSGHPLYATVQSVVLYPLSVVYYLLEFDLAFNLFIILHIILGGVFFYSLMRSQGCCEVSSLISGLTFMFGGYLISVINLTTTLASAIWFPLALLFFDKLIKYRKFKYLTFSSIILAFMFLGGNPDIYYLTACTLLFYAAIYIISQPKNGALENIAVFAWPVLVIIASLLLLAFQILPFLELLKLSYRVTPSFETASRFSMSWRRIMDTFIPFFSGTPASTYDAPWLLLPYLGIASLILVIMAFFFCRDWRSSFFKLTFALGLLLALGRFSPIYKFLFQYLPVFNLIRYPAKFFFISSVSFAYLSGSGWQAYRYLTGTQNKNFLRLIKLIFLISLAFIVLFLLIQLYRGQVLSFLSDRLFKVFKEGEPHYHTFVYSVLFHLRRAVIFFGLSSLFLFFGAKKKLDLRVVAFGMLSLVWLDLYGLSEVNLKLAAPRDIVHFQTPNLRYLNRDQGLFRIYTSSLIEEKSDNSRYKDLSATILTWKDRLSPNMLIEHGIYDAVAYLSIYNKNYSKVLRLISTAPTYSSTNLLNMLNVKYILTFSKLDDPTFRLVNKGWDSYLYENKNYLGRAYLVSRYTVLNSERDIKDRLQSLDFKPDNEVILEERPRLSSKLRLSIYDTKKANTVNIIAYKPNKVVMEAEIYTPAFLVLADNYYPGWYAYIDNKPTKIYKANFILRAVYIDTPGSHKIEFIINPMSFRLGSVISLLSLLTLLITPVLLQ